MKTKIYLGVLLGMMLMVSCSEDIHDEIIDVYGRIEEMSAMGIYDGEWILRSEDKVLCKGQLTVLKDTMEFVLPEEYIASEFRIWNDRMKDVYPDEPLYASPSEPKYLGLVQHVLYSWQGTSQNAKYVDLSNYASTYGNSALFNFTSDFGVFSFGMTIDDTPYRVDYKFADKVTATFDVNTNMWTIIIPESNKRVATNLKTGAFYEMDLFGQGPIVFVTTNKLI